MKTFRCHCGNTLHFENRRCLACQRDTGFLPDELRLSALEAADNNTWIALSNQRHYRKCQNHVDYDACNWMIPADDNTAFCRSCELNQLIPNLGDEQNITLWRRIEAAKQRLLYSLFQLGLPLHSRRQRPDTGLAFEFIQGNETQNEFSNELEQQAMSTGHHNGVITINLLEAEHSTRVAMREKMNERYRTLLGHFRHEIGHYYWYLLSQDNEQLIAFRHLFGDERADYAQALSDYYASGPREDWQDQWVSAYASAHPWEDWAETWAHYLHMIDTLETAHDYNVSVQGMVIRKPVISHSNQHHDNQYNNMPSVQACSAEELLADWDRLFGALNALNRSMGLADAYPFVITNAVSAKLKFLHQLIQTSAIN